MTKELNPQQAQAAIQPHRAAVVGMRAEVYDRRTDEWYPAEPTQAYVVTGSFEVHITVEFRLPVEIVPSTCRVWSRFGERMTCDIADHAVAPANRVSTITFRIPIRPEEDSDG